MEQQEQPRKKQGRPRKQPVEQEQPKKKQGRPRKQPEDEKSPYIRKKDKKYVYHVEIITKYGRKIDLGCYYSMWSIYEDLRIPYIKLTTTFYKENIYKKYSYIVTRYESEKIKLNDNLEIIEKLD